MRDGVVKGEVSGGKVRGKTRDGCGWNIWAEEESLTFESRSQESGGFNEYIVRTKQETSTDL